MSVTRHDGSPGIKAFGRYSVTKMLGQGGMGAVYEAVHQDLGKKVAIKTLHASFAGDPLIKARFLREGQLACKLRHPNVVDIFDVGVQDDVPFMVMEYLDGEDLDHLIKLEGALPIARLIDLMLPVFAAVQAAHEEGIIHRDLKPANIYLARSRVGEVQPKVLDFGLSKMTESADGNLTGTSVALGTPDFMAPEQVQNSRSVDGRCDQYSLGVILYEASTGKRPFQSETLAENVFKVLSGQFTRPRVVRPELTDMFESVVVKAMSVQPGDRYASVKDLARALLAIATPDVQKRWEPTFGPPLSASATPAPTPAILPPPPTRSMTPPSVQPQAPSRPRQPTPDRSPSGPRPPSSPPSNPSRPSRPSVGSVSKVVDTPYILDAAGPRDPSVRMSIPQAVKPATAPPPAASSPSLGVILLATVVGVAVVGGGVFAVMKFANRPTEVHPPPAPPPVTTYHVMVSVSPSTASLQIDGQDAGTGTFTGEFPRDGRTHMLRASADGFEPNAVAFRDAPPPGVLGLSPVVDAGPPPSARDRRRRR